MSQLHTNASIAFSVIALSSSFDKTCAEKQLAMGVLARTPGDGALTIARGIGEAVGMEIVDVRCPHVEYHPGAINVIAYNYVEPAIATGKPVLIILDEAQSAEAGVIEALIEAIVARVEDQPVAVLAITTAAGEQTVAKRMAAGAEWSPDRIAMHRTDAENARLIEKFMKANP